MKILHFISLNNYFISIHVVVRFTHDYGELIVDNDYAIFIQIPGPIKRQSLKNVFLYVARDQEQVIHLQVLNQQESICS